MSIYKAFGPISHYAETWVTATSYPDRVLMIYFGDLCEQNKQNL